MKTGILVSVAAVGLLASSIVYEMRRARDLDTSFDRVAIGMNQAQVEVIMGRPTTGQCGDAEVTPPNGCSRELIYFPFLSGLIPEAYVIWLGRDGTVIHSAHIVSP